VERPHRRKARLEPGNEFRIGHDLVEEAALLHDVDLDPQVIDDDAPQCANGRADRDERRCALDGDVRVAKRVFVGGLDQARQQGACRGHAGNADREADCLDESILRHDMLRD